MFHNPTPSALLLSNNRSLDVCCNQTRYICKSPSIKMTIRYQRGFTCCCVTFQAKTLNIQKWSPAATALNHVLNTSIYRFVSEKERRRVIPSSGRSGGGYGRSRRRPCCRASIATAGRADRPNTDAHSPELDSLSAWHGQQNHHLCHITLCGLRLIHLHTRQRGFKVQISHSWESLSTSPC